VSDVSLFLLDFFFFLFLVVLDATKVFDLGYIIMQCTVEVCK
jgi:hypothetical protein